MARLTNSQQAHVQRLLKGGRTRKGKVKAKASRGRTSRSGNGARLKY
jgi:hypothetical protein